MTTTKTNTAAIKMTPAVKDFILRSFDRWGLARPKWIRWENEGVGHEYGDQASGGGLGGYISWCIDERGALNYGAKGWKHTRIGNVYVGIKYSPCV